MKENFLKDDLDSHNSRLIDLISKSGHDLTFFIEFCFKNYLK